jgi:putative IMPACT (imprinted ancient) family translation regulator
VKIYDGVITDRGSKYAVAGCEARTKADAIAAVKALKRDKKFAKATHNTWALLSSDEGPLKNDDIKLWKSSLRTDYWLTIEKII